VHGLAERDKVLELVFLEQLLFRVDAEGKAHGNQVPQHLKQSIKGPHKATHWQGEATSQHSHRGQQTLRHEVPQAWGL